MVLYAFVTNSDLIHAAYGYVGRDVGTSVTSGTYMTRFPLVPETRLLHKELKAS